MFDILAVGPSFEVMLEQTKTVVSVLELLGCRLQRIMTVHSWYLIV